MTEHTRESLGALIELRDRVRAATGADREIDAAIADACGLIPLGNEWQKVNEYTWRKALHFPKQYTASVDVALALVERVLPGACVDMHWTRDGDPYARVRGDKVPAGCWAELETLPLAILDALLTALIERDGAS